MIKKFLKYKPYLITMSISMLMVFLVALAFEVDLVCSSKEKMDKYLVNTKSVSDFYTIDELERKIKENENDYISHIKLAKKFNEIEEYNRANTYFQIALQLSERSNYSLYSYALFCIQHKLYNHALNLAEELDTSTKTGKKYKAIIYENIAQEFDKEGQIEGSIKAYQVAYKYNNGIYPSSKLKSLRLKYAQEYVKSADIKVNERKIQEAILDLKNSLKIEETPIAKYKLALIYKDSDSIQAEKMIAKVIEENPYIVNPFIYNDLLNTLAKQARQEGLTSRYNYYNSKIKTFNKKLNEIYIFKDDLKLTNLRLIEQKQAFTKKKEQFIVFNLKNNTNYDINELQLLVEIYKGNKKHEFKRKIASTMSTLNKESVFKDIEIKLPEDMMRNDLPKGNELILKIYAKKQKKAPWTMIKIQYIK